MKQYIKLVLFVYLVFGILLYISIPMGQTFRLSFNHQMSFADSDQRGMITVLLNGRKLDFDQLPFMNSGRVMVPIRGVFGALGANFLWDEMNKRATVNVRGMSLEFTPGSNVAIVDGNFRNVNKPIMMVNSRVYVPVRFVAESVGASVQWDEGMNTVYIKDAGIQNFGESGIRIEGDETFVSHTLKALDIISDHSPSDYQLIQNYVGKIKQGERSGMAAYENPPTFYVGNRTSDASPTWYASAISHDAYHSKLYHEYQRVNAGKVPDYVWGGYDAEMQCLDFQIGVLERIRSPQSEVDYARSLIGTNWWSGAVTW